MNAWQHKISTTQEDFLWSTLASNPTSGVRLKTCKEAAHPILPILKRGLRNTLKALTDTQLLYYNVYAMRTNKHIVILLVFIFSSQETPAYAKADQTPRIGAETAANINSARQLADENDYEATLSYLDETLQSANLTLDEKSILFQMKGKAHYEINQYQEAIQAFEDAISSGALLDNETRQLRLNIAQLWIIEVDHKRGADMLVQWERQGNMLKPNHVELIMQAYIQSENYELALPWVERWFQEARPKARKHYYLLNFIYNILGQNEKQIEIVKAMTERWPDDKWLSDVLASIYANNGQEREAFEVKRKDYLSGGNPYKESDILNLVKYHSYYEMPYDAARILEKEMKTGRVSKALKNTVWLSILYQDAGDASYAEVFFAEAVEMSGKIAAEDMRETLMAPQKSPIAQDFGIQSLYPDFVLPKIGRTPHKIVVSDRDAQPLVRFPPVMPENAKQSGYCKLRFNVDPVGRTENIVAKFCTEKEFEIPAIESVEKWKYRPKVVDARQIARSGVETTVKFLVHDRNGSLVPE